MALTALKEIEFDRETGKLSDADYELLKGKYTARHSRPCGWRRRPNAPGRRRGDDRRQGCSLAPARARPLALPADPVRRRTRSSARPAVGSCSPRAHCDRCGTALGPESRFCERVREPRGGLERQPHRRHRRPASAVRSFQIRRRDPPDRAGIPRYRSPADSPAQPFPTTTRSANRPSTPSRVRVLPPARHRSSVGVSATASSPAPTPVIAGFDGRRNAIAREVQSLVSHGDRLVPRFRLSLGPPDFELRAPRAEAVGNSGAKAGSGARTQVGGCLSGRSGIPGDRPEPRSIPAEGDTPASSPRLVLAHAEGWMQNQQQNRHS